MRSMTSGNFIGGLVTPDGDDIDEDDAKTIAANLTAAMTGPNNAGKMAFVSKRLKVSPWASNNEQAQFMEGRRYAREEAALMLGIPMFKLEPSKQTSWGTGVAEQNLGFARETLMEHTSCVEEAVSAVLKPSAKYVEFDYKGLLQGTPEVEVKLILQQVDAGLMSEEQAQEMLGTKRPGGTFRVPVAPGKGGAIPLEPMPNKGAAPVAGSEKVGSQNGAQGAQ